MQQAFYQSVICNREANSRWWSFGRWSCVGFGGFPKIEWENRRAEISLIVRPEERNKGLGAKMVAILLSQGFENLNLDNIYGEVYLCNAQAVAFWDKIIKWYNAQAVILRDTKYWDGRKWDSKYFDIRRDDYLVGGRPGLKCID